MKTLLIIAHDPSPNLRSLKQALIDGARAPGIEGVDVRALSPFETQTNDVLAADAVIFLTPENLGYMSGALKDFFDRCFHDLDGRTDAMPYAIVIRAIINGLIIEQTLRATDAFARKARECRHSQLRQVSATRADGLRSSAFCLRQAALALQPALRANASVAPFGLDCQRLWQRRRERKGGFAKRKSPEAEPLRVFPMLDVGWLHRRIGALPQALTDES